MQAVILAGGFGTRLRPAVADVPKPMAPVAGRPFLEYVLDWLAGNGVAEAVVAIGHMGGKIEARFGGAYGGMKLAYSREEEPLLTGGAAKKALERCSDGAVFVVNGDTYFNVPLRAMKARFDERRPDLAIAVKELGDAGRYGALEVEDGMICGFQEKKRRARGHINGGVYLMRRDLLAGCPERFSLETDFLEKNARGLKMLAFESGGYFTDIGVPEDYEAAQAAFKDGAPP
jgi:D-glycero-alpha-D-manno-heptose 1-phosphate guanylyltransferase